MTEEQERTGPITLAQVHEATEIVLAMDAAGSDPEAAHAEQDNLWVAVLGATAAGHPDARLMAVEALRLTQSNGARWYA